MYVQIEIAVLYTIVKNKNNLNVQHSQIKKTQAKKVFKQNFQTHRKYSAGLNSNAGPSASSSPP